MSTFVHRVFQRSKDLMFNAASTQIKLRDYNVQNEHGEPPNDPNFVRKVVFEKMDVCGLEGEVGSLEWHSIQVSANGDCRIQIRSHLAASRAMATFVQLFRGDPGQQSELCCRFVPLLISDSPKFDHRGLNLDISRNVIYPTDVLRVLDGMWLNKMNRMHLHATDSQSWPLEVPTIPELAQKGAYGAGQIWTVADVQKVQEHGELWGVEVYFEIDLPGHTASIHHSFPELIVAYGQEPWHQYAMEPPAGQLKLNSDAVRDFIRRLFDDVLPRVGKHSQRFHIGGDELNIRCYTLEESIQSDSKDVLRPLLQSFFDLCIAKLQENNLEPILWEDILLEWDIEFPKDAVFQSWKSQESLAKIVQKGHRALFGPCHYWYLDCGMGTWIDPNPDNHDTPIKDEYLDWCSPYKNWRRVYSYDPFKGIAETDKQMIIGGEVHLWAEMVDSVCLDFMLWPRVAAAAEVLWSGPGELNENVTRRLAGMRERLLSLGIRSGMVQMEWSLRNPGSSSL